MGLPLGLTNITFFLALDNEVESYIMYSLQHNYESSILRSEMYLGSSDQWLTGSKLVVIIT